jgi:RND family efflux transporter MFP subunit
MKMSRKTTSTGLILTGILLVMSILIVVMAILKPNGKKPPAAQEAAMPVSVLTVRLTNVADIVYLPAMVEANIDAVLSAEKAGRIVEVMADRGDRVGKDQLLLQIDDRIWQANLKQARIAARDAERNMERFQTLKAMGAVADSEYDSIERAHVQTSSRLDDAKINIDQCRVVSPISGIINDRFVDAGEYVQPGTPVFQVVDHAIVKVVLQVPEKDVFSVRTGDPVAFSVQPLSGQSFTGIVTFVAAQADRRNNAFRTELTVDNTTGMLRPGMIAQVEFHRGENSNMASLPISAVLPSKGDYIVYLAENGQAVRRQVQIETITRERALISEGVESGDRIIVDGNRTLSDGQRIEIIISEPDQ